MATRIGVITDAHANFPATFAALEAMDATGCDLIIHTGDAIGIGPHPREVLDLFFGRCDIVLLMGNHDELFANDTLRYPPQWMSPEELKHQRWTHSQLPAQWRKRVAEWPLVHDLTIGSTTLRFQHYAIIKDGYGPISQDNIPEELDAAFRPETDIVFFGHHHPRADVQGIARYINPGALGTNPGEGARYAIIEGNADGLVSVELNSAYYDAEIAREAMLERAVPAAEIILNSFLKL